jgi:hypothetical protein
MADSIEVAYEIQPGGRLWLRYFVECDLHSLVIPVVAEPDRADGLWNSTCFELFLRDPNDSSYLEFNFSPSSKWAAYRFRDYRDGMSNWELPTPEIYCDMSDTSFALEATVRLADVLNSPVEAALSAVIHETGDTKSYWALNHPPGKPDFHHPDCFTLNLPAPDRA